MTTSTMNAIAVMTAFQEGKHIEFKDPVSDEWYPSLNPEWNWEYTNYRIALIQPKPKTLYKCYATSSTLFWVAAGREEVYANSEFYKHIPSLDKEVELP